MSGRGPAGSMATARRRIHCSGGAIQSRYCCFWSSLRASLGCVDWQSCRGEHLMLQTADWLLRHVTVGGA